MGRVRFAHFDVHMQASKKVLLATEKNVFASINSRTGELSEYIVKLLGMIFIQDQLYKDDGPQSCQNALLLAQSIPGLLAVYVLPFRKVGSNY